MSRSGSKALDGKSGWAAVGTWLVGNRGEHLTSILKAVCAVVVAWATADATLSFVIIRESPPPAPAGSSRSLDDAMEIASDSVRVPERIWSSLLDASGPGPLPASGQPVSRWSQVPVEAGGRRGHLLLLDDRYGWQLGQAALGEWRGSRAASLSEREAGELLERIRPLLSDANHLVALGMSSCTAGSLDRDEELADRRADRLAQWLTDALGRSLTVDTMSLGVHLGPCAPDDERNRHQRRIALLAVSGATSLSDAERWRVLERGPWSGFDPRRYSRFPGRHP